MRDRDFRLSVFIQCGIEIDVVDTALIKYPLTAQILTFDGNHSSMHLVSGEIGNLAEHMGQAVKQVCHSTALVVNDE